MSAVSKAKLVDKRLVAPLGAPKGRQVVGEMIARQMSNNDDTTSVDLNEDLA